MVPRGYCTYQPVLNWLSTGSKITGTNLRGMNARFSTGVNTWWEVKKIMKPLALRSALPTKPLALIIICQLVCMEWKILHSPPSISINWRSGIHHMGLVYRHIQLAVLSSGCAIQSTLIPTKKKNQLQPSCLFKILSQDLINDDACGGRRDWIRQQSASFLYISPKSYFNIISGLWVIYRCTLVSRYV